jgi:GTP-binding protein
MFTDKLEIEVKAGKGGDGSISFWREKFKPKGGPDGGDGGHGGSVIFEVDHNLNTLSYFRNHKRLEAPNGINGSAQRQKGHRGEDRVVKVPIGTMVFEGDAKVADLVTNGQQFIAAKGGRGGFGNAHFVSSVRQAPRLAELGEPGDVRRVTLELKLVADIGLVGLPNAGKSTLLSVISNAKPEIADYPFTTLVPNLGVVDFENDTVLVADIPGLIEGASEGKGLGDEFLRHIERTAVLLHLVDASSDDVARDFAVIQKELAEYVVDMTKKPQVVVLTKIDAIDEETLMDRKKALEKASKTDVMAISAAAHKGLDALLRESLKVVHASRIAKEPIIDEIIPEITIADLPDVWSAERTGDNEWVLKGHKIERFALRTNMDNDEAIERLFNILERLGISRELMRQGIKRGDKLIIGTRSVDWE